MQDKVLPQALLFKGGFGWIVDMTEDISPPPATIKKEETLSDFLYGSGGRTRTSDLRVMSPTSCQLLYPAMYRQMVNRPIFLICECKDSAFFPHFQIFS